MSRLPVDQVYIMHYVPLVERRRAMEAALAILGIDATWITEFDRDTLSDEQIASCVHRLDPALVGKDLNFRGIDFRSSRFQPLNTADISLALKHVEALRRFSTSGASLALILEDDVLFCRDFVDQFPRYLRGTPEDFEIVFLGDGCGLRVPPDKVEPGRIAYRIVPALAKCTDSYLITRQAAAKLLGRMLPIFLPIDEQLTFWLRKLDVITYWWEPNLITQGSQVGIYEASIGDRSQAKAPQPLTAQSQPRWLITADGPLRNVD